MPFALLKLCRGASGVSEEEKERVIDVFIDALDCCLDRPMGRKLRAELRRIAHEMGMHMPDAGEAAAAEQSAEGTLAAAAPVPESRANEADVDVEMEGAEEQRREEPSAEDFSFGESVGGGKGVCEKNRMVDTGRYRTVIMVYCIELSPVFF